MRRFILLAIISISGGFANQLGLLPAQQPIDPNALLDGASDLFDASNIQISNDNLLGVKQSVDKNEIVSHVHLENDEGDRSQAMQASEPHGPVSEQTPVLKKKSATNEEEIPTVMSQDLTKKQHGEALEIPVIHVHHAHHHVHHHVHGHHSYRRNHRYHRNRSRQTSSSVPAVPLTQTEDLIRTDSGNSAVSYSTLPPSQKSWSKNSEAVKHDHIKKEDELLTLNTQLESDFDQASVVGGSWHETTLEGGSSNTRYPLGSAVANRIDGQEAGPHTSGAASLHERRVCTTTWAATMVGVFFALILGSIL